MVLVQHYLLFFRDKCHHMGAPIENVVCLHFVSVLATDRKGKLIVSVHSDQDPSKPLCELRVATLAEQRELVDLIDSCRGRGPFESTFYLVQMQDQSVSRKPPQSVLSFLCEDPFGKNWRDFRAHNYLITGWLCLPSTMSELIRFLYAQVPDLDGLAGSATDSARYFSALAGQVLVEPVVCETLAHSSPLLLEFFGVLSWPSFAEHSESFCLIFQALSTSSPKELFSFLLANSPLIEQLLDRCANEGVLRQLVRVPRCKFSSELSQFVNQLCARALQRYLELQHSFTDESFNALQAIVTMGLYQLPLLCGVDTSATLDDTPELLSSLSAPEVTQLDASASALMQLLDQEEVARKLVTKALAPPNVDNDGRAITPVRSSRLLYLCIQTTLKVIVPFDERTSASAIARLVYGARRSSFTARPSSLVISRSTLISSAEKALTVSSETAAGDSNDTVHPVLIELLKQLPALKALVDATVNTRRPTCHQLSAIELVRALLKSNVREIDVSIVKVGLLGSLLEVLFAHSTRSIVSSTVLSALTMLFTSDPPHTYLIVHLMKEQSICTRLRRSFDSHPTLQPFIVVLANHMNECEPIKESLMHDEEWIKFVATVIEPVNVLNYCDISAQQRSPDAAVTDTKRSEFSDQRWNDFTFLISC